MQLNRAAGRANLALLASLGPLDLTSGEPVDVSRVLDTENSPGLLRLPGPSGRVESLASIFVHPQLDDEATEVITAASSRALASHCVPPNAVERLASGDLAGFLKIRRAALQRVLSERRDALAEPGANDRPAIAHLVVPD